LGSASAVDWNGYPVGSLLSCEQIPGGARACRGHPSLLSGRGRGARAAAASVCGGASIRLCGRRLCSVASPQGDWRRASEWLGDGDAPPRPSRVKTLEWTLVSPPSLLVASMRGAGVRWVVRETSSTRGDIERCGRLYGCAARSPCVGSWVSLIGVVRRRPSRSLVSRLCVSTTGKSVWAPRRRSARLSLSREWDLARFSRPSCVPASYAGDGACTRVLVSLP
jgi:hypothetical protein